MLNFVDNFVESILEYIPFYWYVKLGFVVFLLLGGSTLVMKLVVDPFVTQVIDKRLNIQQKSE